MRLIPYYTVSYHGKFYRAGVEFEIEDNDAQLMSNHGRVVGVKPLETVNTVQAANAITEQDKPIKRAGRPRKQHV